MSQNISQSYSLWRCPNCGQLIFSDYPPDKCAFCDDFTTWQLAVDRNESRVQLDMFPEDTSLQPKHPRSKKP
jgi:hypothetical protein